MFEIGFEIDPTLEVPTEQCSYKTIFHYFSKWSKARLFEDVFYELAGQCERAVVDTSFVKNVGGQDVVGRNLLIGAEGNKSLNAYE